MGSTEITKDIVEAAIAKGYVQLSNSADIDLRNRETAQYVADFFRIIFETVNEAISEE
ncbi:MAG: hypothetical protein K0R71_587 [Bacillales bacterium]|jgi:hypothetical protein|nr:hypothetical protein [Bacillales bacterium]